jgi:hypothetical protein
MERTYSKTTLRVSGVHRYTVKVYLFLQDFVRMSCMQSDDTSSPYLLTFYNQQ